MRDRDRVFVTSCGPIDFSDFQTPADYGRYVPFSAPADEVCRLQCGYCGCNIPNSLLETALTCPKCAGSLTEVKEWTP